MYETFLQAHPAAEAALVATVVGGALLEWAVTYRERIRTAGPAGAGVTGRARLGVETLVETTTTRTRGRRESDRGTKRILVGSMVAGVVLGWLAATHVPRFRMPGDGWIYVSVGLLVIWAGLILRAWSIAALGRFFRRDVEIQEGHEVVRTGPYRVLRHPAYAGNLLAALGLGIVLANWLSVAVLVVLPLLGHLPRIRVEEAELSARLGDAYADYARGTWRLVPAVW